MALPLLLSTSVVDQRVGSCRLSSTGSFKVWGGRRRVLACPHCRSNGVELGILFCSRLVGLSQSDFLVDCHPAPPLIDGCVVAQPYCDNANFVGVTSDLALEARERLSIGLNKNGLATQRYTLHRLGG